MTTLTIGAEVEPEEGFLFVIKTEHGDADGNTYMNLPVGENEAYAKEVVELLKRMKTQHRSEYENDLLFRVWFGIEIEDGMSEDDDRYFRGDSWHLDLRYYHDRQYAKLESWKLYLIKDGKKYNVMVAD